jgi:V8-like Glu-specific endopeptidase
MNEIAGGTTAATGNADPVDYYNRLLKSRDTGSLEAADPGPPDLSDPAINERLVSVGADLHRIVKDELGDSPDLHGLVDEIVERGDTALRVVRDGDNQRLQADPGLVNTLEVVVKSDGSRPSFMIRDGEIARSTSPLGSWGPILDAEEDKLHEAIACIGRIDDPAAPREFWGTGFLVQKDLIVTNRHVLQAVATKQDDGTWEINEGAKIDFGHEHRGRDSVNPRPLKRVVYAGAKEIDPRQIDHKKLDLALIELGPGRGRKKSPTPLAVELATDWPTPDTTLFTIGYPADPGLEAETSTVLELLFHSTFGYKRLAPGAVMTSPVKRAPWTLAHDATTLGGNSGSVVLAKGREGVAAALHYGGMRQPTLENWGHVLGMVLDEPGAGSDKTLREHLDEHGVTLIDSRA